MSGILAQGARFHLLGMPRNYALTLFLAITPMYAFIVTDDRFCPKLFGIFCPESDRISVRQRLLLKFLADIFL